jgi:hypothetical protein
MTQLASHYPVSTSKTVVATTGARPGDAADRTTPRFARHGAHVRAVLAAGGFPVMPR